ATMHWPDVLGNLRVKSTDDGWVKRPGSNEQQGWSLQSGDFFVGADIDGDHRTEIVIRNETARWIGVLEWSDTDGRLAATTEFQFDQAEELILWHDLIPADVDGEGVREII